MKSRLGSARPPYASTLAEPPYRNEMVFSSEQEVSLVADFISTKAPQFHGAFATPSELNRSTMQYEPSGVSDLVETLECHHQRAAKYVDFTDDLKSCTWEDVWKELHKAQVKADESEQRGKNPVRKVWRTIGTISPILAPGLAAFPEKLCVLHGGLAVIFSLARQSEMNRRKILAAFGAVPNIIETARNKAKNFPLDSNPKIIRLHKNIQELQETLLRTLPVLINKLIPGTFRNAWKSPFNEWKIDNVLDEVSSCAESVRQSADDIVEELIVGTYSASMTIQSQLDEVLQQQREMKGSIDATNSKTHLLHFLIEQLKFNPVGALVGRDFADMSEMGTALPGHTPEDLLIIINVNHLQINNDASAVMRRGHTLPAADIGRAAHIITEPRVKELLCSPGPGIVAIDGHFDRTQMGKVSPLSYICAMLSQALLQQSPQPFTSFRSSSPVSTSTQPEKGASRDVVLKYFCALHTADSDDLRGPQGLIRCLTTQLILSMVANEWIGHADAVHLPYLRDGAEELLEQRNLDAFCRLFTALIRLIPPDVSIYCLVDGWSAYEREELWRADYDVVLNEFLEAANTSNSEDSSHFKLLLTSPTACGWLSNILLPGQRVSLRNRDAGDRNWRGSGPGSLVGLARAATMSNVNGDFKGGFRVDEYSRAATEEEGYNRRPST
ncbi:hypothetical protein BP6252_04006 [Coleophoma cylindrospora]|uniref:Fungal STAND N-terminal Goodbye domain-containing protein n=1 Tax=Coleophoma cylindrospora TaxID=1849047 RepID=A0A3D8RZD1_9HELO|nr:hypothetical protein BP6252_04006 [Coleophoma cylindrospora]